MSLQKVILAFVAMAACVLAWDNAPVLLEVEASGPNNNILTGKPLIVPQIIDIFAEDKQETAGEAYARVKSALLNEPPSAALMQAVQAEKVDALEVLDLADKRALERRQKKAKKQAKKAAKKAAGAKNVAALKDLASKQEMRVQEVNTAVEEIKALTARAEKLKADLPRRKAKLELLQKKLGEANAAVDAKLSGKTAGAKKMDAKIAKTKAQILAGKLKKLQAAQQVISKSLEGLKAAAGKKKDAAAKTDDKKAEEAKPAAAADAKKF